MIYNIKWLVYHAFKMVNHVALWLTLMILFKVFFFQIFFKNLKQDTSEFEENHEGMLSWDGTVILSIMLDT